MDARRAGPFVRSALSGVAATGADLAALFLLIDLAGLAETAANAPALLVGVTLQYALNKYWAFGDTSPASARQIALFGLVEAGTFALNLVSFHLLVTLTSLHYVPARAIGSCAVYAAFSYPLWARIFRPRSPAPGSGRARASAGA